jgi:multidrug efflux pump subunit AcrB
MEVIQAIQQQSQQVTAGQVGMPPTPSGQAFQYTQNVNGRLDDASQFEDIIVKTGNNGELRGLIRRMSIDNPFWGAPRIHGELLRLGFEVAQSSVAKYMVKRRAPPSQGWRPSC